MNTLAHYANVPAVPVVFGRDGVPGAEAKANEWPGVNSIEDSSSMSSGSPNSCCNLRNFSIVDCYYNKQNMITGELSTSAAARNMQSLSPFYVLVD
jgi:hypothetical protein